MTIISEDNIVQLFIDQYYGELQLELQERNQTLINNVVQSEDFMMWFNEAWVADKWINHVNCVVNNMTENQYTSILVAHGLDRVFDMCRAIGLFQSPERITTEQLAWYVINDWYCYDTFIRLFQDKIQVN